jgi:hypothetical protein
VATLEKDRLNSEGMPWEEAVEWDLTKALMHGIGWLMSESSARRLTSLCLTRTSKEWVEQVFQSLESNPSMTVHASELPRGEPTFFIHENGFVWLPSREALHRWLSLHQKNTTFIWPEGGWIGRDEVWLPARRPGCSKRRSFVESRGMKLTQRR